MKLAVIGGGSTYTPELAELRPGHDAACHVAQNTPEEVKAFS